MHNIKTSCILKQREYKIYKIYVCFESFKPIDGEIIIVLIGTETN